VDKLNTTKPLLKIGEVSVNAGSGPHHLSFHPMGRFVYLSNELSSTVTAYIYDEEEGTLQALQTISTLPEDFEGANLCSDIHVAPSGMYVYTSN
jgi:6-phosphogluconolactonase